MGRIGQALRFIIAIEGPDGDVAEHTDRRIEQTDIDLAAFPRALGIKQARYQPEHGDHAAGIIDDR